MVFFGQNNRTNTFSTSNPTANNYTYVVTEEGGMHVIGFIMPGIRFSKSPERAFQFAAAGVLSSRNGDLISFPVPMCSWFFKF